MKPALLFLIALLVSSCAGKVSLTPADTEYIITTLDLLKTRANFASAEDSINIKLSLDSVYRKHHTSAADYQAKTVALSDDRKHAEAIFGAINDSINKK